MRRALFLLFATVSLQAIGQDRDGYYEERQRGWFWFEQQEEPEKEKPQEEVPPAGNPQEADEEKVRIDVKWLRENLPQLREAAINNPSRENIALLQYAKRYMLDLSSRYANKSIEFMQFETALDESKRRPYAAFSLDAFKDSQKQNIKSALSKINSNSHIWFFYSSTCPYCAKQVPVLQELSIRFDIDILAISMDGGRLPGTEEFTNIIDRTGVSRRFNVRATPTILLAEDGGKGFTTLGEGLVALPQLQDRILLAARMQNIITDSEYESTQEVREINVLSDEDGVMLADKNKIENDPGYLAEVLRQKLMGSMAQSATPINREGNE